MYACTEFDFRCLGAKLVIFAFIFYSNASYMFLFVIQKIQLNEQNVRNNPMILITQSNNSLKPCKLSHAWKQMLREILIF